MGTLVESYIDIESSENIKLRIFLMGISKKVTEKKNSYIRNSNRKEIRKIFNKITFDSLNKLPINEIVKLIMSDKIDKEIEEGGSAICALQNCHVRKVKVLRRPREIMEEGSISVNSK